jgi:hypothetical protein
VQLGLNKGEAKNALARAVFFNRLGELRDRSFENQRYRASGLNLVVAAIVLWNTVYLGRAVHGLREQGQSVDEYLLAHLSPLGWEHINLTGDYVWHSNKRVAKGRFRPLRSPKDSVTRLFRPHPVAERALISFSCTEPIYVNYDGQLARGNYDANAVTGGVQFGF